MLVMPSLNMNNLNEMMRTLQARATSLSSSWTATQGTPLLRKASHTQVVERPRQPEMYSMPWQILPRGSYTPAEDRSTSYKYAADLTAELPITSAAMYILSEDDNLGAGAIHVYEDSEDKLVGTDLLVDIRVYYNSAHVRRTTDISFVHNELQNENGVRFRTVAETGDQVQEQVSPHDLKRFFSINVRIPRATGSDPTKLPAFRTHLPNFIHTIGELAGCVHFSSISLSSSHKPIFVRSLAASRTRLRTSDGAIEGSFTSDSSVSLRTANAPITADITLGNNGSSQSHLELLTTFDEIKVDLTLAPAASHHASRPSYRVNARSSDKPVTITCISAPPHALTHFEVQTTNAPVSLTVPESFEGAFALHSTPLKPMVAMRDRDIEEEEKKVEVRELIYSRERRGLLEGRVVSQDSDDVASNSSSSRRKESSVLIKTSNAEARLFL